MPALAPSIVFADEYLVVAEKPAGLRSIPAGGEGRKDCLAARIRLRHADALIVHRLDAATSGLVLFARGAEMLRRMNRGFRERVVGKQYVALVHGHVTADAGEIALPLGPEPHRNPRQMVDLEHGQAALSRFRVLAREGDGEAAVTRLELKPVTGRTHQLRVHLMSIGHPIIGDPLYAPAHSAARHGRMHLHAMRIAFIHPHRRVALSFESPPPF